MSEILYFSCPVFMQNIATSTYGYYLHNTRYDNDSKRYLKNCWSHSGIHRRNP
jgi:hypothetical protein